MGLPHWSHNRNCFYKYTSAATAKSILEKNCLRWALPLSFNDPFDVQFDLRVEYDADRVIDQALGNIIDLYMGRRHVPNGNKLAMGVKLLRQTTPGLTEEAIRAQFRHAMSAGLANAQTNMPENQDEIRAVLGKLKLLCLSEVHDNILMWAHYAKDHTGVVIEFSVIEEFDSAWGAAKPVRYRTEMPYLVNEEKLVRVLSGEGTIATDDLFEEAVFVKAADWAYEKEWRLVGGWDRSQNEEFIPFNTQELTAVYLGCRISTADEEITKLVDNKFKHACIYKGTKSKDRFAIDFAKV